MWLLISTVIIYLKGFLQFPLVGKLIFLMKKKRLSKSMMSVLFTQVSIN